MTDDLPDDVMAEMMAAEPDDGPKRRGRPPKARDGGVDVQIVRDWWDEDGERQRAGSIITLDPKAAVSLVSRGIAKEPA